MNPKIEKLQTLVTTQQSEKADAIVWLQGNMYDRGKKVLELYQAGFAPWVVVTGNNTRVVDDDTVRVDDIVQWLKERQVSEDVMVIDKESLNTYDQAVNTIGIVKDRAWKKILLVGSTHHQLRAFLTFLHQAQIQKWNGRIINQPINIPWDAKPSGRRVTARGAFVQELNKLERYKDNMATVESGLQYFQTL